jgi:hypothetical protein
MTSTGLSTAGAGNGFSSAILLGGALVGVLQVLSPVAVWWLHQDVVWAVSVVAIAFVYVGFAVADGRPSIIAVESAVAMGFVVLACVAIIVSPWLLVVGLVGHGLKDLWQHHLTCEHGGGSPGNRTLNLRIKSPLLCLVELATPTGIVVAHRCSGRREAICC